MPNVINSGYPAILRTGGAAGTAWHQTSTGLLWQPPGIMLRSGRDNSASAGSSAYNFREGFEISQFELHNRSGGVAAVGLGGRLANRFWIAGTLTSDNATFTDRSAGYQAQTATIFGADGATNDGVCILSRVKFEWVSANLTTAEVDAGAAVDHTVQYSTGSTWTTLGTNAAFTDNFTLTNTVYSAAVKNLVFAQPVDWTVTAGLGGVPNGWYGLLFTSAQMGAGDTAAIATGIEIGKMVVIEALADNAIYAAEVTHQVYHECDGVVAYFATANAGNRVYAEVTTR